jgi:hypothetical protein
MPISAHAPDFNKGLPSATEAEKVLIGAILTDTQRKHYDVIRLELRASDFVDLRHRKIFERIGDLWATRADINYTTLYGELGRHGEQETVGGLGYLLDLTGNLPEIVNIHSYVGAIKQASLRRCGITKANEIEKLFWFDSEPIVDVATSAADYFSELRAEASGNWPAPEPLQAELPPVQAFDPALLPESLRALVEDVSERMQVPLDLPAATVVLCLAGAVNRRSLIQPKAHDTSWTEVLNLWGGIVAPPGYLKSPVLYATAAPLNRIESLWRREHATAQEDFATEQAIHSLRHQAWKESFKAAIKANKPEPIQPDNTLREPILRRLITNDFTLEKLHETMSQNPAGILLLRDELTGWLSRLERDEFGQERAFALTAWTGKQPYTIERIGRGLVQVDAVCLSVLGGITPDRLRSYLVDALAGGPSNDGLMQRFQVLVWPDTSIDWRYVDSRPNATAEQKAAQMFDRLVQIDPEDPIRFCFSVEAQSLFIEWIGELEARIRGTGMHPALVSHISKYRGLMPALAALFELADGGAESVSLQHARQAAAWCQYLESHAGRIYSCVASPQLRAARVLGQKIKDKKVGASGVFSVREAYLKGWTGLDTADAVKVAVAVLMDARWLRELPAEPGPRLVKKPNRAENTR